MSAVLNLHDTCYSCNRPISPERRDALPDTHFCASCSGVKRVKGDMVFSHKTAPTVQIVPDETFRETRKYYVARGPRSAVKNFSRHICA